MMKLRQTEYLELEYQWIHEELEGLRLSTYVMLEVKGGVLLWH